MSFVSKCDLHIPYKHATEDWQHDENYKEIERWAQRFRRECLPSGGGATIYCDSPPGYAEGSSATSTVKYGNLAFVIPADYTRVTLLAHARITTNTIPISATQIAATMKFFDDNNGEFYSPVESVQPEGVMRDFGLSLQFTTDLPARSYDFQVEIVTTPSGGFWEREVTDIHLTAIVGQTLASQSCDLVESPSC